MLHSFLNVNPSPASASSPAFSNSHGGSWISLAHYFRWRLRCLFSPVTLSLACTRSINLLDQQLDHAPSWKHPNAALLGGQLGSQPPASPRSACPRSHGLFAAHTVDLQGQAHSTCPLVFLACRNFSYLGIFLVADWTLTNGNDTSSAQKSVLIQVQQRNPWTVEKSIFSNPILLYSLSLIFSASGYNYWTCGTDISHCYSCSVWTHPKHMAYI